MTSGSEQQKLLTQQHRFTSQNGSVFRENFTFIFVYRHTLLKVNMSMIIHDEICNNNNITAVHLNITLFLKVKNSSHHRLNIKKIKKDSLLLQFIVCDLKLYSR